MKKKTYKRMIKKIHEINKSPLAFPIIIKKLKPLSEQTNYNPKLREWYGPKEWEIVAETTAIFDAFKQSEEWKEIGMLGINDYRATINNDVYIDHHCIVQRADTGRIFEVVFIREYIGEYAVGLRPVNTDGTIES